jgi:hemerythrin-like domain-containing protein
VRPAGTAGLQEQVRELVDFFTRHLDGHFRAEEGILFPLVVNAYPNAGLLIESLVRDHEKIRGNIACLPRDANPAQLLFAVGDVLETHIRREERELFPLVVDCLAGAEADRVSAEIERVAQARGAIEGPPLFHSTPQTK